jgi:hypothetical protein
VAYFKKCTRLQPAKVLVASEENIKRLPIMCFAEPLPTAVKMEDFETISSYQKKREKDVIRRMIKEIHLNKLIMPE